MLFKGYRNYRKQLKNQSNLAETLSTVSAKSHGDYTMQQVSELTQQVEAIKRHLGIYLYKNPAQYEVRELSNNGLGMVGTDTAQTNKISKKG